MKSNKVVAQQLATKKQYNDLRDDARMSSQFMTTESTIQDNNINVIGGNLQLQDGSILQKSDEVISIIMPNTDEQMVLISLNITNGDTVVTYGVETSNPVLPQVPQDNAPIAAISLKPNTVITEEDNSNSVISDLRSPISAAGDFYTTEESDTQIEELEDKMVDLDSDQEITGRKTLVGDTVLEMKSKSGSNYTGMVFRDSSDGLKAQFKRGGENLFFKVGNEFFYLKSDGTFTATKVEASSTVQGSQGIIAGVENSDNVKIWNDGGEMTIDVKNDNVSAPISIRASEYNLDEGGDVNTKDINAWTVNAGAFKSSNFNPGAEGFALEGGNSSTSTLRFDSDEFRIYSGKENNEVLKTSEYGNIEAPVTSINDIDHTGGKSLITKEYLVNKIDSEDFVKQIIPVPSNSDLNNIIIPGRYGNASTASSNTVLNRPGNTAFMLDVMTASEGGSIRMQVWTSYVIANPVQFYRTSYAGTWGEWFAVPNSFSAQSIKGRKQYIATGTGVLEEVASFTNSNTNKGVRITLGEGGGKSMYFGYNGDTNYFTIGKEGGDEYLNVDRDTGDVHVNNGLHLPNNSGWDNQLVLGDGGTNGSGRIVSDTDGVKYRTMIEGDSHIFRNAANDTVLTVSDSLIKAGEQIMTIVGSVTTPSIGIGDTNTGFYDSGSDQIGVTTGGVKRGLMTSTALYYKGFGRLAHQEGGLIGSYNNVGENSSKTNPIYSIGTSYLPNESTLGNHYGVGYTHRSNSTIIPGTGDWGMYVSADGDARSFISGGLGASFLSSSLVVGVPDGALSGNLLNHKSIAIGDSDTGLRQNGDGVLETWANNQLITQSTTSSHNIYKPTVVHNSTSGGTSKLNISHTGSGRSELNLHGTSQGGGVVYVGQTDSHGGGIEYDGSAMPGGSGASSDYTALFRRNAGVDTWVARWNYASNIMYMADHPRINNLATRPTDNRDLVDKKYVDTGSLRSMGTRAVGIKVNNGTGYKVYFNNTDINGLPSLTVTQADIELGRYSLTVSGTTTSGYGISYGPMGGYSAFSRHYWGTQYGNSSQEAIWTATSVSFESQASFVDGECYYTIHKLW